MSYELIGVYRRVAEKQCKHDWVSNSGDGGVPKFKNGMFGQHKIMYVRCRKCGGRIWLTETQWDAFLRHNVNITGTP